jgi:hypothetical protein
VRGEEKGLVWFRPPIFVTILTDGPWFKKAFEKDLKGKVYGSKKRD